MPFDGRLNNLYGWCDEYLWVGVLFKAVAKLLTGYHHLSALSANDVFKMVTGANFDRLQKIDMAFYDPQHDGYMD
jgi:hypothetical protein